jgi:hypothetical protein
MLIRSVVAVENTPNTQNRAATIGAKSLIGYESTADTVSEPAGMSGMTEHEGGIAYCEKGISPATNPGQGILGVT